MVDKLGVAVRQHGGILVGPFGVEADEAVLKVGAGGTGHAADEVKAYLSSLTTLLPAA